MYKRLWGIRKINANKSIKLCRQGKGIFEYACQACDLGRSQQEFPVMVAKLYSAAANGREGFWACWRQQKRKTTTNGRRDLPAAINQP
jgi:hypothetical protein